MKGRDAVYRIAPFALFIAFLAAAQFVESPWVPLIRGVAVALLLAAFWPRYVELRGQWSPTPIVLAIAAGIAVFFVWIHLDAPWAVVGDMGKGYAPLHEDGSIDWVKAGLRLFGLALVVPVMEELFWRSFLMRWIDRRDFLSMDPRAASFMAFALSSALFALEHTQWLAGLVAGVVYTWVYKKTANLWYPILAHAITNGTLGTWILATGNWRFW